MDGARYRLSDPETLWLLLGDEAAAAWRLGAQVTLHQQNAGWGTVTKQLSAGGLGWAPAVVHRVHCIRLWATVEGDDTPIELGTYEAHAARTVLMMAATRLKMNVVREEATCE